MFFFGNTFYCDSREVISKDYGELIDRWAKENPKMKLGPFVHRKMEGSTVAEIEIRFGYPYVFMHLGNCEHLITFIEARYADLQFTKLNLKNTLLGGNYGFIRELISVLNADLALKWVSRLLEF